MKRSLGPRAKIDRCIATASNSRRGLTNVAADGRDQVVGLCMIKVESPAAELRR
jgi:hypothetical protein